MTGIRAKKNRLVPVALDQDVAGPVGLAAEAGAYAREGLVDLGAQEGKDQNNDDSDQHEDECIFDETLSVLLQLLELSAQRCHLLYWKH